MGFMGSGKSTVGRALADRLGWSFLDLDELVEHWAGMSVADVFARWGEARFRELERAVAAETLPLERVVLAPGGGWAAAPGRLSGLPPGTLTVWLRVGADEAVRRVRLDRGRTRPLLEGADAEERARTLLARRRPWYGAADLHLDTHDLAATGVVDAILDHMSASPPDGPPG